MDQERFRRIGQLLAASERAAGTQESLVDAESALPPSAVPKRPGEVAERIDANLVRPDDIKAADWDRARELFLKHAGGALARLGAGNYDLDADQGVAMEAVIIADGSRPSFPLCNGEVAPDDPFLGIWAGQVAAASAAGSGRLAAAVGRIQPQNGHASRFIGTGSLIDRDKGLVLTNYHVIRQAETEFDVAMTPQANGVRIEGVLEIDFAGEACSLATRRFRIVEAFYPPDAGVTFAGLDAAVARIEPIDAASLPAAVPLLSLDPAYACGALTSLALIGFPAAPAVQDGKDVDWTFVIRTLFGNRFGVKRLAPGRFTKPLGSNASDAAHLAIGHDATTFGGASGSLVAAWLDKDTPCFALHFGGQTEAANYALAFAVAHDALAAAGMRF